MSRPVNLRLRSERVRLGVLVVRTALRSIGALRAWRRAKRGHQVLAQGWEGDSLVIHWATTRSAA